MKKRIVLCADDYGQVEAVSKGILDLVQLRRLSAVSCLVNGQDWPRHAMKIAPFKTHIALGLHINLTEGQALSKAYIHAYGENFSPLKRVMAHSFLGRLDQRVIEAELESQIERFTTILAMPPHFIDGHQHVHHFPIIRDALINVYHRRFGKQKKPYIRLVQEKITWVDIFQGPKKIIIHATGVYVFKRLLKQLGIPHNQTFAGIYNFKNADQYPALFLQFLSKIRDNGLIMCHPGLGSQGDVIAEARFKEYQYFISDQFLKDCKANNIMLG